MSCICGKRTPDQTTCYHSYYVCDHWKCNTKDEKHTHGAWIFDCTAWNTKQESNHTGTGGDCAAMKQVHNWKEVVKFFIQHSEREYCAITAQRETCMSNTYSHQYYVCYTRCTGCNVTNTTLRKPPDSKTCF